ncbi:hypothetical protein, partial [Sphaerochaeta sp. PS]|uniref:hypothetical protein n=1 Tax=Sphaerochaeta sp. PS TaxID=3076336 RepID=UPI0028A413FA
VKRPHADGTTVFRGRVGSCRAFFFFLATGSFSGSALFGVRFSFFWGTDEKTIPLKKELHTKVNGWF